MKKIIASIILFFAFESVATTVGIVDSGFYKEHSLLQNNVWVNTLEIQNRLDDDRNGYVDDLYGWNFASNNRFLFDLSQLDDLRPLTYKFMSIAAKLSGGLASEEELAFIQENLIDLPIPERNAWIAELNFYGGYAHGTHVAGVVVKNDPEAEIVNMKFFPSAASPVNKARGVWDNIQSTVFTAIAEATNIAFKMVGGYLADKEIQIANMSLGIPMERLAGFALIAQGNTEPTEEELAEMSQKIYKEFEIQALDWMNNAGDTLFIAASGNSGLNNDVIPAYPANVDHPNMISVGATIGYDSLGEYSNYGMSVDVAAPGTAVLSSAPGLTDDFEIEMTGTSMAAPFVAGMASGILTRNKNLQSQQVKRIILETVDKKEWLEGKVATSGVVNIDRAFYTAELTKSMGLDEAISLSKADVADMTSDSSSCETDFSSPCLPRAKSVSAETKKVINQIFNLN